MSKSPWSPLSGRPPLPGEREAWLDRSQRAKEGARLLRQEAFEKAAADEKARREALVMAPRKPAASRFTTQAAVDWGRRQGWRLIDREDYDARTKRHRDLMLGTDCLFDDGEAGMVAIQGAGRYERAAHRARFEEAGGEATARRRGVRVIYLEFERGNPVPIVEERWS